MLFVEMPRRSGMPQLCEICHNVVAGAVALAWLAAKDEFGSLGSGLLSGHGVTSSMLTSAAVVAKN